MGITDLNFLYFFDTRHEEKSKEKIDGKKAGNEIDRTQVHLSEKGKQNSREMGKKILGMRPYFSHITFIHSGFIRAVETGQTFLEGGEYERQAYNVQKAIEKVADELPENQHYTAGDNGSLGIIEEPGISLSNVDWYHPGIPDWTKLDEDIVIKEMLKNFYKPQKGTQAPSMAKYAGEFLDAKIQAIETEMRIGKMKSMVLFTTHAPVIDAAAAALGGYFHVDKQGNPILDEEQFPGAFAQGEAIMGHCLYESHERNPMIELFFKGKQSICNLKDLKEIRDIHLNVYEKFK